jgi:hypothetical protein
VEPELHASRERQIEGPGQREKDTVAAVVAVDITRALPVIIPATFLPRTAGGEAGLRDHHDAAGIAPVVMGRERDGREGDEGEQR